MRTTLDIDNDVLEAAKDIAAARKKTTGQVLSDLAREALSQPRAARRISIRNGFPMLEADGGVVTSELVERLLLETELEEAGVEPG